MSSVKGKEREEILEMYRKGMSYERIAIEVGRCAQTITTVITRAIASGEIEKVETVRLHKRKEKPKPKPEDTMTDWERHEYGHKAVEGQKCTELISQNCIYGLNCPTMNRCQYVLITGLPRGCPWWDCTKFVQIDEEHPRLYAPSEMEESFGDI